MKKLLSLLFVIAFAFTSSYASGPSAAANQAASGSDFLADFSTELKNFLIGDLGITESQLDAIFGGGLRTGPPLPFSGPGFTLEGEISFLLGESGDPIDANIQNILTSVENSGIYTAVYDFMPDETNRGKVDIRKPGGGEGQPAVPIDGGLSFLALSGIAFGIRRFRKK